VRSGLPYAPGDEGTMPSSNFRITGHSATVRVRAPPRGHSGCLRRCATRSNSSMSSTLCPYSP
jgi:hypothetical protein